MRVIRACKEMGIKSVAVYSEADANCRHLELADEQVCIGGPMSAQSYLNIDNILKAAKETKADAIHPGYGYLAESEKFAQECEKEGFIFIGPNPENLKLSGDKVIAKNIVKEAGVPVIPSSMSGVATAEKARELASEIGYPVVIKASGGGGGRGIRVCEDEEMLLEEFYIAKMEAGVAFGNDELYLEKCIVEPRHIEFQVLADNSGKVIHLGERECTIQRRYQKLIEESPSPRLSAEMRKAMGDSAIAAAKAVRYFNAGTVEFLVDRDGNYYFMEINARIQVEHPITEIVTGVDLIKEQIRLASGEQLEYSFNDLTRRGWAIECRINAEDPHMNFAPSPGIIEEYYPPGGFGVRLDTHLYQGYELPIYYDSLIAKLISYDLNREGAINVMRRALEELRISPVKTTIPLYLKIMDDPMFRKGEFNTGFIRKFLPEENDEDGF